MKPFLYTLILFSFNIYAKCNINLPRWFNSRLNDPLALILNQLEDCPKDVNEFKEVLASKELISDSTMVSNRGFHNSNSGSLSFFEMIQGKFNNRKIEPSEFFFGHFTFKDSKNNLKLAQEPNGLMIELIVWDPVKEAYNFYELVGDGVKSQWFYRGDSFDILKDNKLLHLQKDPNKPVFGQRLRCSGCHTSGGPIMKELSVPHNDWWTKNRPLSFKSLNITKEVQVNIDNLQDANLLAINVKKGIKKLEKSPTIQEFKSKTNFQEVVRPLFTTSEINFSSDSSPLVSNKEVIVPSEFWIDSRLGHINHQLNKNDYINLLKKVSKFPESDMLDSDHTWLTPIKSYSDITQIDQLLKKKLLVSTLSLVYLRLISLILFSQKKENLFFSLRQINTVLIGKRPL